MVTNESRRIVGARELSQSVSNLVGNDVLVRPIKDVHYLPAIVSGSVLNVDVVADASALREGQWCNSTPGGSRISPILSVGA